ncbi:hypothetical protein [Parafilimonas sp.]|uniref:hypothetical protein n=1 Tax=Parafilimonas sp. TaxID=1969739 RepID=UPI0039E68867
MSLHNIYYKFTIINLHMYRKIILFSLCFIITAQIFAQQQEKQSEKDIKRQERKQHIADLIKREEEGALIYNKQSLFGFKLNTDGWTAIYEHGKYKTITTTNTWFVEIGERKSHKEERITPSDPYTGYPVGNSFIYGKQNVFYNVNIGIGQQRLIGGKGAKNGVAVSAIYGGGFSAGLLKPYYVTVYDPNTGETEDVKYQGASDTLFLNYPISGAGLTKGFGEMKFVPGLVAHAGLRFDYGRYNELLSALEIGVSAEFYTKDMPIMVNAQAKQFFYNAYVAIEFGFRK